MQPRLLSSPQHMLAVHGVTLEGASPVLTVSSFAKHKQARIRVESAAKAAELAHSHTDFEVYRSPFDLTAFRNSAVAPAGGDGVDGVDGGDGGSGNDGMSGRQNMEPELDIESF